MHTLRSLIFSAFYVMPSLVGAGDVTVADSKAHQADLVKVAASVVRTPSISVIVYRPPKDIGSPTGRVGGGSRDPTASAAQVEILAPDHIGRTSRAQPVIYWFLSKPIQSRVDLFLSSADDREALLDITLKPPLAAGMHHIALSEHGASLAVGERYKFHVFLRGAGNGPQSTAAIAVLQRVAQPANILGDTTNAVTTARAKKLADHGLWYDAIAEASKGVEQKPENRGFREVRAQLLEQVGLQAVAEYDRRQ